MNILITICARGGSKGVKNKNIKYLAGKPLIAYTIETAKKWGKADDIVCSTDSENIAVIAKKYGAKVPFVRPSEIARDSTKKFDVIRHAMIECEKIYDKKYDFIIDLDVTNPVRRVQDLENCLRAFKQKNANVLYSVVKAKKNPYFNMFELNKEGYAEVCKKTGKEIVRRQDAPPVFVVNASIYFFKREFLLNEKNSLLFEKKIIIQEMSEESGIDIDSELDFKFIEFLLKEGVIIL